MSTLRLILKLTLLACVVLELSGCIATAVAAGAVAGGYYEKNKSD